MLPPGTLAALNGHHNGIVAVAMFAIAAGTMSIGTLAWPVVVMLSA